MEVGGGRVTDARLDVHFARRLLKMAPPIRYVEMPGRGVGVLARRNLRNGEVIMVEGCRVCKKCGQGSAIAKTVAAAGQEDTNLDKSLKRSAESLRIANNVWGSFSINVDPDHAPAWTKRRRL